MVPGDAKLAVNQAADSSCRNRTIDERTATNKTGVVSEFLHVRTLWDEPIRSRLRVLESISLCAPCRSKASPWALHSMFRPRVRVVRGSAQLPVFGDRAVITDQAAVFLLSAVATVLPNGDHGETGRSNMPNICSIRLFRDSTSQNAKQHDRDCQRSLPRSWRNSGGGGGSVGQILF